MRWRRSCDDLRRLGQRRKGEQAVSARDYTQEELLEVLLGESSEDADQLISDCRVDDDLAGRVRRLAELDSLLKRLGEEHPRSQPSPDVLARYLHAPDSLEPAERMAMRVPRGPLA